MKKFFKYLLATFLGGIASAFTLFLLLIIFIAALASGGDQKASIEDNSLLILKLNGEIVERHQDNPLEELLAEINEQPGREGLNRILKNITKAKTDDRISGILLESGMMEAGYATIEEIRNALLDFKSSGKFVYSYSPVYTQKAYYLASVADKVYMNPGGLLVFKGLHASRTFFKNTLEKLGVEMQIFRHGKFKSAVEPFTLDKMSESSRLQTEVYVNSIWKHLTQKIAEARGLSEDEVNRAAETLQLFKDDDALMSSGLIDGLIYKDELITELKKLTNTDESEDINSITNAQYANISASKESKFERNKIAIIYAEGEIDGSDKDGIKSEKLSREIRKARRDSSIKAIVLRVNSPGGSALGSDIIWREVKLAKETKPVVVSMGDLAASGGYYISCAADYIVAHPNTLTGSIGIFGMVPNTEGLMNKIGLTFDGVKTNKYADMPSMVRPFSADETEIFQAFIEKGYDKFISRCAEGRNTSKDAIDKIGQGRVWSGSNSLDIELIDELGGINRAIEVAKEKAGLENYRIIELPELEDPISQIMRGMTNEARLFIGKSLMGEEYKYLKTIEDLKNGDQIQARMPYNLTIK